MKNNILQIIIANFLLLTFACETHKQLYIESSTHKNQFYHLRTYNDSLFNSIQKINVLSMSKKKLKKTYFIDISFSDSILLKTSVLAVKNNAIVAINGGFFNMKKGGSISYFEKNDSVINYTQYPRAKREKFDSIINGALIITKKNKLKIEIAKPEDFYKKSKKEHTVLLTGPILIKNSKPQSLPNMSFTHKRHPRTCIGYSNDSIFFVTIDGRNKNAAGMNLYEAQDFLKNMGSTNAINLDGGGSTSLWIKNKGIINTPSDKSGERPVANALIIKKR